MKRRHVSAPGLAVLFVLIGAELCLAQEVVVVTDSGRSLQDRSGQALVEARRTHPDGGFWVGYSIDRLMGANAYVGTHYSDARRNRPTLEEMITGVTSEVPGEALRSNHRSTIHGNFTFEESGLPEKKVLKEIGILAHFTHRPEADEIVVSNLTLHADLNRQTLFWLGSAGQDESLSWLSSLFGPGAAAREDAVAAIGLHEPSAAVAQALGTVAAGDEGSRIREAAVFWLGQSDRGDALAMLMRTARGDRSTGVREQAVFAVSQMTREEAVDSLIALARRPGDASVRRTAIFWLGQKASRKTEEAIRGIVEEDGDTEVQKSALYALGQNSGEGGLELLLQIAKTHRNREVRTAAIYMIGESEDPRAVDLLVELLRD